MAEWCVHFEGLIIILSPTPGYKSGIIDRDIDLPKSSTIYSSCQLSKSSGGDKNPATCSRLCRSTTTLVAASFAGKCALNVNLYANIANAVAKFVAKVLNDKTISNSTDVVSAFGGEGTPGRLDHSGPVFFLCNNYSLSIFDDDNENL
ncbi:hypothetical protein RN001_013509 [Aquatica leii]|uniref:Uncharacterized protein n=1 Tax=Aquatica leii TaxID=1421715 RepID=A0AAN7P067_9COLE|nr:hypothetical protein RN001_013509 [Aquatica leii]